MHNESEIPYYSSTFVVEQEFGAIRKIILMTYGRSGSSFTSDIIQKDPSVFYTFEPLWSLMKQTLKGANTV